ncbi:MAG: hypothetical protein E6Q97_06800 [Desulfurellales bacterium]|nr:MAG: hypothetical protein E6Q97_06800 [Desulfurellales bacterium]
MSRQSWEWFGTAGHLIVGDQCRFHLATVVSKGKYLVSTVGFYIPSSIAGLPDQERMEWLRMHANGEEIGCGRFYETMVFEAGNRCRAKSCACGLPEISGSELDYEAANRAKEATENHMKLCLKWDKKR